MKEVDIHGSRRSNGGGSKGATVARMSLKSSYDTVSEAASQTATEVSQGDSICSVPAQMISSSSYGWAKSVKQDRAARFQAYLNSRSLTLSAVEPTVLQSKDSDEQEHTEQSSSANTDAGFAILVKNNTQVERPLSFHSPDIYQSKELSMVSILPFPIYTISFCKISKRICNCALLQMIHLSATILMF